MDRDLEDFPKRARELGERWITHHASATPNAEGSCRGVAPLASWPPFWTCEFVGASMYSAEWAQHIMHDAPL